MKPSQVKHVFVEFVPDVLEEATLYLSIPYDTIVHACLCGCGSRIVTPLSPTDWRMTYDGDTVSLLPSVGNWSFECQSHYWIDHSRVRWAGPMSREKIEAGRRHDLRVKQAYFNETRITPDEPNMPQSARALSWLARLLRRS